MIILMHFDWKYNIKSSQQMQLNSIDDYAEGFISLETFI